MKSCEAQRLFWVNSDHASRESDPQEHVVWTGWRYWKYRAGQLNRGILMLMSKGFDL